MPITDPQIVQDLKPLPGELAKAMIEKTAMDVIRYTFCDIKFRVCYAAGIEGQTWFLRRIQDKVPMLDDLALPLYILKYLSAPNRKTGLYLFAGAQSAGKTTLASAMIATRLTLFGGHCITFESPAEMPLEKPTGYGDFGKCFQTEIDSELELPQKIARAHSYASPDIIFIGEIKTAITAVEALRASLGSDRQMVVATIHGTTLTQALMRLLNFAKEVDSESAALNLATTLSCIVHTSLKDVEKDGKKSKRLEVGDFLLLPPKNPEDQRLREIVTAVRAKIKDKRIESLINEISQEKALIQRFGDDFLIKDGQGVD
jgi:twitching motility protein PilT